MVLHPALTKPHTRPARSSCVDYLPTLDGTAAQGPNGPVQIIVPSYRFTCPGILKNVTVRVHGNETGNNTLYAQIWRPLNVSAGSYSIVWAGSYPDQDGVFTVLRNNRSGDNVTFFTKLNPGFPLLPNDVVGLLATGPLGFQLAYVTNPGGMNVQTTPNQRSCNLPLCGTLVTKGLAPALTVEMGMTLSLCSLFACHLTLTISPPPPSPPPYRKWNCR